MRAPALNAHNGLDAVPISEQETGEVDYQGPLDGLAGLHELCNRGTAKVACDVDNGLLTMPDMVDS